MNIAVINAKDLLKYILKFFAFILTIIIIAKILENSNSIKKDVDIKKTIENTTNNINNYSFINCLDTSLSLFSYNKTDESKNKVVSNSDILAMGVGIFDKSIFENTDLVINESELTIDDAEELANQAEEISKDVTTEAVQENNITPKVTSTYGNVQINNQSKYDITEEILTPDAEITNKKDILIYHTHTCESYTPSERI